MQTYPITGSAPPGDGGTPGANTVTSGEIVDDTIQIEDLSPADFSAFMQALFDDPDATTVLASLGITRAVLGQTLVTGRYYRFPNGTLATSSTLGTGSLRLAPKFIPAPITLDRLGAEVTTIGDVGSKVRLGIYNDDGQGRPSTLVLDAGQINGDSATVQPLTINQALNRGWYWFGGVVQSVTTTQPTVRTVGTPLEPIVVDLGTGTPGTGAAGFGMVQTGVTGALPASLASPSVSGFAPPSIFGRLA